MDFEFSRANSMVKTKMGMKISICGKGGSGKSTLVALLAAQAGAQGFKVLVVDSDESNSGLYRTLGFSRPPTPLMELVGGKKELKRKMSQADLFHQGSILTKDIPADYVLRQNGLMLVSIGKIMQALEGCACPMGVLSREFLKKLELREDEIAFIDMEAGVEHFGRGIDAGIDGVLLVVEPSFESVAIACKIKELAAGIGRRLWAVLNKVGSEALAVRLKNELDQKNIPVIGVVPHDPEVFEASLDGRPLIKGEAVKVLI